MAYFSPLWTLTAVSVCSKKIIYKVIPVNQLSGNSMARDELMKFK